MATRGYKTLSIKVGAAHARQATGATWFMTFKNGATVRRAARVEEAVGAISSGSLKVRVCLEDSQHVASFKLPGGDRFGYELIF